MAFERGVVIRFGFGALGVLALLGAPAAAQTLMVEGVVSPAWVERGGARLPLAVGMQLIEKDRIVTGPGSRALLRMAEGSAIKLGESASLVVGSLEDRAVAGAALLVMASLDVVRGAFRFTTGIFGRPAVGRDVRIRISTATVGIRGTDLWGKSDGRRDLVCLIEGSISVSHAETGAFTMADPLSFFVAPRGEKPLPVAPVDPQQLTQWAGETEIQAGSGGARRGGRHFVTASVSADQRPALAAYNALRAAGYPAVVRPSGRDDGSFEYRVGVPNLATQQDAEAAAAKLKALGIAEAVPGL
ncbi:MAG TPA: FecR family protein [Burkholderiales bacterium]